MPEWKLADQIGAEAAAKVEAEQAKAEPRVFLAPADHLPPYMPSVILQGMMLLFAAVMAIGIYFDFAALQLMQQAATGGIVTQQDYETVAGPVLRWIAMAGAVTMGTYVLCAIAYLNFVYAAARNLDRARAAGFNRSPWGAVGVSFIPLANFVLIYQVMRDIWVSSHDPRHGAAKPTPLLGIWWLLFISGNLGTRLLGIVMRNTESNAGSGGAATYLWIESGLLAAIVVSCLLLFKIVGDIRNAQGRWADLPPATAPEPAPDDAPLTA